MAEKQGASVQDTLERLRGRMDECRAVKPGNVDFHLSGASGGEYRISSRGGKSTISSAVARGAGPMPLVEIWGDSDTICAIIDGKKDPVKQFLSGGIRVRGNLRYFSDVAVELGILHKPL
jgi:hypothetical protein